MNQALHMQREHTEQRSKSFLLPSYPCCEHLVRVEFDQGCSYSSSVFAFTRHILQTILRATVRLVGCGWAQLSCWCCCGNMVESDDDDFLAGL